MTRRNFWKRKPQWQILQKRRPPKANQGKAMEKERVSERRTGKGKMLKERRNRIKNRKKGPRSKKRSRKSGKERKKTKEREALAQRDKLYMEKLQQIADGTFWGGENADRAGGQQAEDGSVSPSHDSDTDPFAGDSVKQATDLMTVASLPPRPTVGGKGPGSNGHKSSRLMYLLPQRLAWDAKRPHQLLLASCWVVSSPIQNWSGQTSQGLMGRRSSLPRSLMPLLVSIQLPFGFKW